MADEQVLSPLSEADTQGHILNAGREGEDHQISLPRKPSPFKRFSRIALLVVVALLLGLWYLTRPATPDFLGLSLTQAAALAREQDATVIVRHASESSEPQGTIIEQDPAPLVRQIRYSPHPVLLVVSAGEGKIRVPDVSGLAKWKACHTLLLSDINSMQCPSSGNVLSTHEGTIWATQHGPQIQGTEPRIGTPVDAASRVTLYTWARTTQVSASHKWQDAHLMLLPGTTIEIRVVGGGWTEDAGVVPLHKGVGGLHHGQTYICANDQPVDYCPEPMPHAPRGALIGKVRNRFFSVGNKRVITSDRTGELYLRINDAWRWGLEDNSGSLIVKVLLLA